MDINNEIVNGCENCFLTIVLCHKYKIMHYKKRRSNWRYRHRRVCIEFERRSLKVEHGRQEALLNYVTKSNNLVNGSIDNQEEYKKWVRKEKRGNDCFMCNLWGTPKPVMTKKFVVSVEERQSETRACKARDGYQKPKPLIIIMRGRKSINEWFWISANCVAENVSHIIRVCRMYAEKEYKRCQWPM